MDDSILGLVLAGGRGRRAGGADKGLLEWRARPLVAHVVDRLRPQVDALWISANRNHGTYAAWADHVLPDRDPGHRGPLEGVATALAACDRDWLLCVPVDMPGIPTDLARRLHAAAIAAGASLAVAHDGERRQVLCFIARPELGAAARTRLSRGDAAVHAWQDASGAITVDFADRAADFANLNHWPAP